MRARARARTSMCSDEEERGEKRKKEDKEEDEKSQEDPDICLLSHHADKRGGDDEEQKKTIFYTDVQREGRVFLVATRHSLYLMHIYIYTHTNARLNECERHLHPHDSLKFK